MRTMRVLLIGLVISAVCLGKVYSEDGGSKFMTAKIFGGYNMWILGSAAFPPTSTSTGSAAMSGLSFGADVLFLNPNGIQLGVGFAYLPMMVITVSGAGSASWNMLPITANVVFNTGIFYTDLGVGLAVMTLNANSSLTGESTNMFNFTPSPGLVLKTGIGLNIKLLDFLGLDIGGTLFLPVTDFGIGGMTGTEINPFLGIIMFSQFNLRAGICFYI